MKTIEIKFEISEDCEFVAFRHATTGEFYINGKNGIERWDERLPSFHKYIVVRMIQEWEPVDPTKITLSMLPLAARFRGKYESGGGGVKCYLMGMRKVGSVMRFVDKKGYSWEFCEVLKSGQ